MFLMPEIIGSLDKCNLQLCLLYTSDAADEEDSVDDVLKEVFAYVHHI